MGRTESTRTRVPLKSIELLVLAVLADGPRHGYGLAQEIERRSRQRARLRAADLYRVLYRLVRTGLIEEAATPPRSGRDQRRTDYRITPLGRRTARAEADYLQDICAGLLGGRIRTEGSS